MSFFHLTFTLLFLYCYAENILESHKVRIRFLNRRSESGSDRELHLMAFGKNYHLRLRRSPIFSSHFRFMTVTQGQFQEESVHRRSLQDNDYNDHFFTVEGNSGSLHVTEGNGIQVEGIIDEDVHIQPLSANESDAEYDHVVFRPFNEKRSLIADYILPKKLPVSNETLEAEIKPLQKRQTPSTVIVEILPVLDYGNARQFNGDQEKLSRYIGIFWNNVLRKYADTNDPKVVIIVTGIIAFNDSESEIFIKKNKLDGNKMQLRVLDDFRSWLADNKRNLPQYDSAMLHLSYDAGAYYRGRWYSEVAGLAYLGGTCMVDDGYGSSFTEDRVPYYSGITTAAHEMAHGLNVPHDGEKDASECSKSNGYIMGERSNSGTNNWHFSSCSLQVMSNFLKSKSASCLQDTYVEQYALINSLPGIITDVDDQCRSRYGNKSLAWNAFKPTICSRLWCTSENKLFSSSGALEGTPCGFNQVCLNGICSDNPIPSPDDQCFSVNNSYMALNKDSNDVCQDLLCTDEIDKFSAGEPLEGSNCGNGGKCVNNICLNEIPDLDEQCKRWFGRSSSAYQKSSPSVCRALWCLRSSNRISSYGEAIEGSICGRSGICVNKLCQNQK